METHIQTLSTIQTVFHVQTVSHIQTVSTIQKYDCLTDKQYIDNKTILGSKLYTPLNHINREDLIVYGKVQSGKTQYIINKVIDSLLSAIIPIVICSDSLSLMEQFTTRFRQSNLGVRYNTLIVDLDSISRMDLADPIKIYLSIANENRFRIINELISTLVFRGYNFTIIYDEADISIKNDDKKAEIVQKELYAQYGAYIQNIYISATNFSVYNSGWRNLRKISCEEINSKINDMRYIGYEDCNLNITSIVSELIASIETDSIILSSPAFRSAIGRSEREGMLSSTTSPAFRSADGRSEREGMLSSTTSHIMNFINFINQTMDCRHSALQPNIGLLRMLNLNFQKKELAILFSRYLPNFLFLCYTGDDEYNILYHKGAEIFKFKDNRNKYSIGTIIQYIKDNFYMMGHFPNSYPLFIISYKMAGRAQTFKSSDHLWTLTHLFLDLQLNSPVDTVIQSLRACGQYFKWQKVPHLFLSENTHNVITLSTFKNFTLNNSIFNIKDLSIVHLPDMIKYIPFLNMRGIKQKFNNRNDNTKAIYNNYDDGCDDQLSNVLSMALQLMESYNYKKYYIITERRDIPIKDFINFCSNHQDGMNIITKIKDNGITEPYGDIPPKFQNEIRKWILDYLKILNIDTYSKKCQLGYTTARAKELNKIHHEKGKNFQANVLAINPICKTHIPLIIYNETYINNSDEYKNSVLIWHGLDEKYHVRVNTHNNKYHFVKYM